MTQLYKSIALVFAGLFIIGTTTFAQEEASVEAKASCESSIDIGLDVMSSYIWRGSKFGTGPAFQPFIEKSCGDFAIGAWGSINSGSDEAFELDLYTSYSFPFGVSLTLTDYYFGGNYLGNNFDKLAAVHSLEPMIAYEYEELTFTAALMFLEGNKTDFYGEVSYAFENVDFAVGAGNGQYLINPEYGTPANEEDFAICNISLSTEKEVQLTDKFALPFTGSLILNPFAERLFLTVGFSL